MMRAPAIRYTSARTVAEAAAALADHGSEASLLAGGTDLVPNLKRRQQRPRVVVGIRRVPELSRLTADRDAAIGACVTLADIAADKRIAARFRALHRAAVQVATPLIRNMGTIGGNLCLDTRCTYYDQGYEWRKAIGFCMKAPGPRAVAVPEPLPASGAICWVAPGSPRCLAVSSTDGAPALIALGARVALASRATGEREIPVEDLYADDGMRFLSKREDEVLTEVRIPAAAASLKSTYLKLRRRGSFDFPILSVAAALRTGKGGAVEEARLVLGAVASRPVLVPEAATLLLGRPLTDDAIDAIAQAAMRHAHPLDNTDLALAWRKKMVRTYVTAALRELRGDDPASLGLLARRALRAPLPVIQ
jgi:4-hydroxybenzoyl-CoA reductase subunit beta